MNILSGGLLDFFGLDIGTTGIRVVEIKNNSGVKTLARYGYIEVDPKLMNSDSLVDQQKVAAIVKDLVSQTRISTKNVAVGLPSPKVFTTVVDIERLSKDELAKTIRFQADSLIPTPLADSKIDWELVGDSPADKAKVEVLLSSVANDYVEKKRDQLEAVGLNVIAFEPDSLALTRALLAADVEGASMLIDIGNGATDIVITINGVPRLTRTLPTGYDAVIRSAMQNLNIDQAQAQQFVIKFGMSKEKLEGQILNGILPTIEILTGEIEKTIKFFASRYGDVKIKQLIVTGGASVIPEFPLYLANKFGLNVEIGNAWRNVAFPLDRQNELMTLSNAFSVAVGLAERNPS